jgi:O-antigen/teichoic acid export membrane protein
VETRSALQAYLHVLSGSMGRLVLQGLYFALLVNALSLADYGVFASALAASIIIANVGSFGSCPGTSAHSSSGPPSWRPSASASRQSSTWL